MKKTLIWILGLALLAAASVLATIAFLTYEETEENIMTIGKVRIDLLEYERINTETANGDAKVQKFTNEKKPLRPAVTRNEFDYTAGTTNVDWTQAAVKWEQADKNGYTSPIWDPAKINNEVDKMVFLKNSGDYGAYVRLYFAFEAGNFNTLPRFQKMIHINLNDNEDEWAWEWIPQMATNEQGGKYFIARATYQKELKAGDFTEISLSQIALDSIAMNEDVRAFGKTYEVFVNAQGIQSMGFEDPDTALDEGFGTDIPFDMTLAQGVSLYDALHYLEGDKSGTDIITEKVTNVTFGFNKDHQDVVNNFANRVVLTSGEQDAEVYTYYVPNGPNYDVYVLADKKIYTPKDSTGLFQNMTSLTTVDTTNMDVSRTEIMKSMFMSCKSLTSLDVSQWDVSKVKSMNTTFTYCYALKELNVSSWNVSNVTTMASMFYDCKALTSLDVTNWDVKNVTDMTKLFYNCQKLNALNVSNWEVDNVTTMRYMFYFCEALESLTLNSWNVSNVTTFERMFSCCYGLTSLNISGWDTTSATNMAYMFFECQNLGTIDVSGFDLDGVTTIESMFEKCFAVQELNVQNWNVSSVTDMSQSFRKCYAVVTLDLSGWVTSNVISVTSMFGESMNLKTIYVGNGWDMSQILEISIGTVDEKSSIEMFFACSSLVGGAGTKYKDTNPTDKTYARVDAEGTPGYLTYKEYVPATPEA